MSAVRRLGALLAAFAATAALGAVVVASTWAAEPAPAWTLQTTCRAPNGDGVLVVQNPTGAAVGATLAADGRQVGVAAASGTTTVAVPWRAGDDWHLVVDGTTVASTPIDNRWCIKTDVRVERMGWACDATTPVMTGYQVTDNDGGVALVATPPSGGAAELGTTVVFSVTDGAYATAVVPSPFTVADGGTFNFAAVVRYDAGPPDCTAPGAPQIDPDAPDAFALYEEYWNERFGPIADSFGRPGAGLGGAASSTVAEAPADPVANATDDGASDAPAPEAATAPASTSADVLPRTGAGSAAVAVLGVVLVAFGVGLVGATRPRARRPPSAQPPLSARSAMTST